MQTMRIRAALINAQREIRALAAVAGEGVHTAGTLHLIDMAFEELDSQTPPFHGWILPERGPELFIPADKPKG